MQRAPVVGNFNGFLTVYEYYCGVMDWLPRAKWVVAVAAAIASASAGASIAQEDALTRSRELYQRALAAYNEGEYGSYLQAILEVDGLRRNHPRVIYMVAGAYALNGRTSDALEWLNRLADMALVAEPEADGDFSSIRETEGFAAVLEKFAANGEPLGRTDVAFSIPGQDDFIPEGIAHDPLTGNFYAGSIYKRAIVEVRPEEARAFASWERGDGLWSVFALRVDPARRVLWACSSAIEQTRWLNDDEVGYAGVFQYDLTTRALVKRYVLSNSRGPHLFGDMTLSRAGDVYITDSAEGAIYRIDRGGAFERWLESDRFTSLQGIAFSQDERYLFVADYSHGVFRIDVKNRGVRLLPCPDDLVVLGIDGLAYYDGGLLAIQNGVRPHRVVHMRLAGKQDRIDRWKVLAANHPDFEEPTLGIVVANPAGRGATFYYVANSHWGAFDREGKLRPSARLTPPVILQLDLE
jgi:hypothetical protein